MRFCTSDKIFLAVSFSLFALSLIESFGIFVVLPVLVNESFWIVILVSGVWALRLDLSREWVYQDSLYLVSGIILGQALSNA